MFRMLFIRFQNGSGDVLVANMYVFVSKACLLILTK